MALYLCEPCWVFWKMTSLALVTHTSFVKSKTQLECAQVSQIKVNGFNCLNHLSVRLFLLKSLLQELIKLSTKSLLLN